MLRTGLIHPQILEVLGAAGHGALVLISDANFPHSTTPYHQARRVYLNLRPGLVAVNDILSTLQSVISIEKAVLMDPDEEGKLAVHAELVSLLDPDTQVDHVSRQEFYAATRSDQLALVVASGDDRWYANILLTIGSVPPAETAQESRRPGD